MGFFDFLGVLSPVHINWTTLLTGAKLAGTDGVGNRYYSSKAREGYNHNRRWVVYKGAVEASRVPPEWHGWLHYQSDIVPGQEGVGGNLRRPWQVPHKPNLTGTRAAYRPPGHVLAGGRRDKATGDYEAWIPPG